MSRYIFDLSAWKNNTTPDAKGWVEEQFSRENYSEEIVQDDFHKMNSKDIDKWVYEAWDLRALLEQAYMAGKESVTGESSGK